MTSQHRIDQARAYCAAIGKDPDEMVWGEGSRNDRPFAAAAARGLPARLEWISAAARDRCCYCGCETWLPRRRFHRRKICERLGIPAEGPRCRVIFGYRMATIEHLDRRADGGLDCASNLALACAWCNSSRADVPSLIWAIVVAGLVAVGRHPCFPPPNVSPFRTHLRRVADQSLAKEACHEPAC